MKKLYLAIAIALFTTNTMAQLANNLIGIVRKNYGTLVTDPFDSTITYMQFDSATVRLGYTPPGSGYISNSGSVAYNDAINLTGAALNPYSNSYIFIGYNNMNTFDLATGLMSNSVPLSNANGPSFFDLFRFNNADSSLYGLARRNFYDSTTMTTYTDMYLAHANSGTGVITEISPTSIGQGFALSGSAINPYQMVYYYSTGSNLVGLDIYNGSIYSNVPITITDGVIFDNFTYSCADTALYGLVRQSYYHYEPIPLSPGDSMQVIDSSTIKLGKIDPATGIVTNISPYAFAQGGYSVNGGAAIDPNAMIYYFSRGNSIMGVSMITGMLVSDVPNTFEDGEFFDMIRNFENCITASAIRTNPGALGVINQNTNAGNVTITPIQGTGNFTIKANTTINNLTVYNPEGRVAKVVTPKSSQTILDMQNFGNGIYLLKIELENKDILMKKIIKN